MTEQAKRILVTGANGFVGSQLCRHLLQCGYSVRAVVRRVPTLSINDPQLEYEPVGDLLHFASWSELLRNTDAIVHLIARTHITDEFGMAAMQEYRRTNVDLTRRLAKAAAREGVSRFVYMSSIKAVGNGSEETYCEQTKCQPEDSYGKSKLEAEQTLAETLRQEPQSGGCEFTVLRPPLVYGPQVQGNFLRLLQLVARGVPLPSVTNARSMVHVENLVQATELCLRSPQAANRTFHVADPEAISTSQLIQSMAAGLERPCRLIPLPKFLLRGMGQVTGKTEEIKRLAGSLTVSTERITSELNWQPKYTTRQGIVSTSRAYRVSPWDTKQKPERTATPTRRAA